MANGGGAGVNTGTINGYQWYKTSTNGYNGNAIDGATLSNYSPESSIAGQKLLLCSGNKY